MRLLLLRRAIGALTFLETFDSILNEIRIENVNYWSYAQIYEN